MVNRFNRVTAKPVHNLSAEANDAKGVKAVSAALQLAKQKAGSSASLQPSEVSVGASSPQMVAPAADAMARVESVGL